MMGNAEPLTIKGEEQYHTGLVSEVLPFADGGPMQTEMQTGHFQESV